MSSDTHWLQASLILKDAGLGIKQVRLLALPAFMASAASNFDLQPQILLPCCSWASKSYLRSTSGLGYYHH